MIGKLDQALRVQGEALRLRAQRQEMLASNLANSDTPHYKAVDFRFSDALRAATGMPSAKLPAPALVQTARGHMTPKGAGAGAASGAEVLYRTQTQSSVDGNTVDADVERANFADNAVRYEASLRFLNGQVKTLLSAVQGS